VTTNGLTFGKRLRIHRERTGKSRAVLGGLVGRSEEWVKALETDRLLMPRLSMLLRLAEVLGVTDLAELTGDQSLPVASVTKAAHPATPAVTNAMLRAAKIRDVDPSALDVTGRVARTWELWHRSRTERTAVGAVLPGLIDDARTAVRLVDGTQRRRAYADLAQVYHLTQIFLAFQPATEMVWLAADRGMSAAENADDPVTFAGAAWYCAHIYRFANQLDAAEAIAVEAAERLGPDAGGDQLALWGQMQLAGALTQAKAGRAGQALRHWDLAAKAARTLGPGYMHPWLTFGQVLVDIFGVEVSVSLYSPGEAIRRADAIALDAMPSPTRRASLFLDTAQAYVQQRDNDGVLAMLNRALRESVDTVRHRPNARQAVVELLDQRGAVRSGAREVALAIGLAE
jgi:transcriptional regulator with XRE-family HTH domain/tetratricopeptide (TPR) repeat protein